MDGIGREIAIGLLVQAPVFLAYVIAMLAAVIFWKRCPTACMLTFIGAGLLLALGIGQTLLQLFFFQARAGVGGDPAQVRSMLQVIGLATNFLRALGVGLLVAAVFVGRTRDQQPWPEEQAPPL
jgi:hypothetical protein